MACERRPGLRVKMCASSGRQQEWTETEPFGWHSCERLGTGGKTGGARPHCAAMQRWSAWPGGGGKAWGRKKGEDT